MRSKQQDYDFAENAIPAESATTAYPETEDFQNFLADVDTDLSYYTYLYRQSGEKGKRKYTFVYKYENYVPDINEVAEMCGAGTWRLIVKFWCKKTKKQLAKSKDYVVDDMYFRIRDQKMGANRSESTPPVSGSNDIRSLMSPALEVMREMFSIMRPMIEGRLESNTGGISETFNNILISNFQQQQRLISMITNKQVEEIYGPEKEPVEENGNMIFEILKYLWDNYGKAILHGGKNIQAMAKEQLAGNEQLQDLLKDPNEYIAAYNKLCETANKEEVDRVLSILEVPAPDELLQNTGE